MPPTVMLNAMRIGGIDLLTPRSAVASNIDKRVHETIITRFPPHVYTDGARINAIFQFLTEQYTVLFQPALDAVASITLLGLALGQYDLTNLIEAHFKAQELSIDDAKVWRKRGPVLRRAIKWLCESLARYSTLPNGPALGNSAALHIEAAWHIAEQMTSWAELSDQTRYIVPDTSTLTIHPADNSRLLTHHIHNFDDQLFKRIEKSRNYESVYLPKQMVNEDISHDIAMLDPVFVEQFGVSYETLMTTLVSLIEEVPSETSGCDVPQEDFDRIVSRFAKDLGAPRDVARRLIDGFTIDKLRLDTENRKVWEANKQYRLFRRGMIVVRHDGRTVITWSREMARGALNQLMTDMCFQQVPSEWQSVPLTKIVSTIALRHGKQFESLVGQKCHSFGIRGVVGRLAFGTGTATIQVPRDVGEIDFLGFSESMLTLVILEAKGVWTGSQSRFFRNDLIEFDGLKKSSFAVRFRRKIEWVLENAPALCKALESEPDLRGLPVAPTHLAHAIVTRQPIYLTETTCGIPTVGIVELCLGLDGSTSWPFGGRVPLP